ncbi:MAG: hypothetical protein HYZ15_15555 [Sphingobacteriales bacterium]|nr:hypothetical protein [Sphingobacteriales bacterium]
MKKLSLSLIFTLLIVSVFAQDTTSRRTSKNDKKEARRQKVNNMIRQAEEGVLVYQKQSVFGFQARTNGYGLFYELGRMKTNRKTNIYRIDITEIKHLKENKVQNSANGFIFFGNPFIYGKINNFYQVTLGFGQQRILGQKGNKNGVAVSAVYNGGLSLGLLRPYYLEVEDPVTGDSKVIKYSVEDSSVFLGNTIIGGGGIGKGWGEMKVKPGVFAKTALRFDYGRFNEVVSGLEIGISGELYAQKIPIMAHQKDQQFFFQAYIALLFGRRK